MTCVYIIGTIVNQCTQYQCIVDVKPIGKRMCQMCAPAIVRL